jgi:hypothetical protein
MKQIALLLSLILLFVSNSYSQCQLNKIYVNAVLADPSGSPGFDTDDDGTVSSSADEFIQLCNDSTGDVIVTGWTINDAVGLKYTFGTDTIHAGECITIINNYQGSTPMPAYFRDRNSGSFVWNNTGDDIIISDGTNSCTETYTTSSSGCVRLLAAATNTNDCSLQPSDLGSAPLDVDLISFNAKVNNFSVVLSWVTASEINNSHFEVMKSIDGQTFEQIGRVDGAGNSASIQEYSFQDKQVKARQYYKLKQLDFDGQFAYSDVVLVKSGAEEIDIVTQTTEKLILQPVVSTRVLIANQTGQIVLDTELSTKTVIYKRDYANGMFTIQAISEDGIQFVKWINIR